MTLTIKDLEVSVDTKEPDDTFVIIQRLCPKANRENLSVGDIAYKNVIFELKTFGDFIASIKDKRFRNQLYNFFTNKDIESYYIIYGKWTEINKYSSMNINALLGAIASIEARYGVHVLIFPNKEYAIYTICKIIEKSFDHKEVRPDTFKILTNERAINMICASAEKVGIEDAKRLLGKYGTVKNIVNLSAKELESVHKIGEKKATRIIETVTFDFSAKKKFDDEFIDFDIENDKVNNETSSKDEADIIDEEIIELEKKVNKKKTNNQNIFYGQSKSIKDYERKSYTVYTAIKIYNQKTKKSCPLKNILSAVKVGTEQEIKQLLYDLELESKIYQSKKGLYEVY